MLYSNIQIFLGHQRDNTSLQTTSSSDLYLIVCKTKGTAASQGKLANRKSFQNSHDKIKEGTAERYAVSNFHTLAVRNDLLFLIPWFSIESIHFNEMSQMGHVNILISRQRPNSSSWLFNPIWTGLGGGGEANWPIARFFL